VWKLGICQSMLAAPESASAAAEARRDAVQDRVIAYNTVLKDVCGQYPKCRYDGGAVFDYAFTAGQLSQWDWFRPSPQGQAQLARILYRAIASKAVAP
jgi:hypothetical protein